MGDSIYIKCPEQLSPETGSGLVVAKVNCELWVIMTHQCRVIKFNKYTVLVPDVNSRGVCV